MDLSPHPAPHLFCDGQIILRSIRSSISAASSADGTATLVTSEALNASSRLTMSAPAALRPRDEWVGTFGRVARAWYRVRTWDGAQGELERGENNRGASWAVGEKGIAYRERAIVPPCHRAGGADHGKYQPVCLVAEVGERARARLNAHGEALLGEALHCLGCL